MRTLKKHLSENGSSLGEAKKITKKQILENFKRDIVRLKKKIGVPSGGQFFDAAKGHDGVFFQWYKHVEEGEDNSEYDKLFDRMVAEAKKLGWKESSYGRAETKLMYIFHQSPEEGVTQEMSLDRRYDDKLKWHEYSVKINKILAWSAAEDGYAKWVAKTGTIYD